MQSTERGVAGRGVIAMASLTPNHPEVVLASVSANHSEVVLTAGLASRLDMTEEPG